MLLIRNRILPFIFLFSIFFFLQKEGYSLTKPAETSNSKVITNGAVKTAVVIHSILTIMGEGIIKTPRRVDPVKNNFFRVLKSFNRLYLANLAIIWNKALSYFLLLDFYNKIYSINLATPQYIAFSSLLI